MTATIRHSDRVKRQQAVVVEVISKDSTQSGVIPHLDVSDVLEFAKRLEEKEAPLHEKVVFVESGKDTGLLSMLRVDWKEETVNGEPAPQVAPRERT